MKTRRYSHRAGVEGIALGEAGDFIDEYSSIR